MSRCWWSGTWNSFLWAFAMSCFLQSVMRKHLITKLSVKVYIYKAGKRASIIVDRETRYIPLHHNTYQLHQELLIERTSIKLVWSVANEDATSIIFLRFSFYASTLPCLMPYVVRTFRKVVFATLTKLPAMEKTWMYVCTMITHPKENTRRPWRQVRLSLAAGSVLMILLPLTVGLNASKNFSQKPEKVTTETALKNFQGYLT